MTNVNTFLQKAFFDPSSPASFSGPKKLLEYGKSKNIRNISLSKVIAWLKKNDIYTLRRKVTRKFDRTKVYVPHPNYEWDLDLMDMQDYAKENDGFKYVIVMIDLFSRFGHTVPIKGKTANFVIDGMKTVFDKVKPVWIRTDKGGEFLNKKVKDYLKKEKIGHIVTQNEPKANFAERFIKTLKNKIVRVMLYRNSASYIKDLPKLTYSYNNTVHRSIDEKPADVKGKAAIERVYETQYILPLFKKGQKTIQKNLATGRTKPKRYKFKVGDQVRITHLRHVFSREYDVRWTGEIFTVTQRFRREGIPLYSLKDYSGEEIQGTFYQSELQRVIEDPNAEYKIEKVIDTRGRGKNQESLVKFLNWPSKYNVWLKTSTIRRLLPK
jgi:hypothetical protein